MRRSLVSLSAMFAVLLAASSASAQVLGPFTWHLFPFCNTLTLTVTQVGSVFRVDGFDGQCSSTPAAVTGIATLNPNGTVGMGLTILTTPGVQPVSIDATISVATLSGPWTDSQGHTGTFVPGPIDGPPALPLGSSLLTSYNKEVEFAGRRANKTTVGLEPIGPNSSLVQLKGLGFDGVEFSTGGSIRIQSAQPWAPGAHGTRMLFQTTLNNGIGTSTRMTIDSDGQVGIGLADPLDLLDVAGDIRVGTGTGGCVRDRDGTQITGGACVSDARFKRDIVSFEPVLGKIASLRPVHYFWRADEFPTRAFGSRQSYGLVAQEVENVLPELVSTDADGYKAVNYSKLPLIALQAIKELKTENDVLKAQLADVVQRLSEMEARFKER